MKTVLITGASGFVGSHIVEESLKHNYLTIAGIRTSSSTKYLTNPNIKLFYLNLNDKEQLKRQLLQLTNENGQLTYIIHNAGITKARKINDFWTHNYETTKNFVDAIIELNILPEKFIYVSSLAAFGAGDAKSLKPIELNDIPNPQTEYGKSKLAAEEYVSQNNTLPWIIFRPTGIYGPRDVDYFVFLKTIQQGFEPYIGFDNQYLTFIYVKDLANLIIRSLSSPYQHKAYFVSDGKTYTSKEYAQIVKNALNKKTIPFHVPLFIVKAICYFLEFIYKPFGVLPVLNKDKYQILSSRNWKCNSEETFKDFNFVPQYDLEKGVIESIKWYKENGWLK